MRKVIFIVAGVLGGLLVLGAAALLFLDVNQFREPIRAQLEKKLERSVSIRQLGLKLIPLSIRVDDLSIGESPKFPSQAPFVAAKETFVSVGLVALLRKQVNVESLRVTQPAVELIRNAEGVWNASTLGGSSGSSSSGSSVGIADLRIEDGRIAVTDLQQRRPRAVYDHIDIALRDLTPGKDFQLDAQAHLPAKGKETVSVHVTGRTPDAGKSLASGDFDGVVSVNEVSMTGLQAFLGSTPSEAAKAVFNGKVQVESRGTVLSGKGSIDISEPRLKDPARLAFEVRDDSSTGLLAAPSITLKLGGLAVSGDAKVQTKAVPATVAADFRADNASLADLLSLASAFGVADGTSGTGVVSLAAHVSGPANAIVYDATGTLRDARLTLDSLRKPVEIQSVTFKAGKDQAALTNISAGVGSTHLHGNADVHNFAHPELAFTADIDLLDTAELEQLPVPAKGTAKAGGSSSGGGSGLAALKGSGTVTVGTIRYNQLVLTNVRATSKLENGVFRLDPLTAKLFGGDQAGSIAVDMRTLQTAFDVHSKIQKVDANKLLSSTTSIGKALSGLLAGSIDVKANPRPGQDVAQALNGTVKVQLTDGKLAGVQLMNEMATLAKFIGYAPSAQGFTNIIKLAGTLNIQDGVATTDDLQLEFEGGSLAAAGTLGLADQQIKMRVTAVLPKAVGQRTGVSQIGGLMTTALSNSKGELVIPALVSGTFAKPRFEPDVQRMAKMKLEGLLPTRDNPLAPVSRIQGMLGALGGAKAAPAAASAAGQPQQQKKKGLFDIIDSARKAAGQK